MHIGKNIKYLRQQNSVTQEALAEHLGISYQAVSKWETGANTPDISLLPRIAKYFRVSLDTLFSENIATAAEVFEEIQDDGVLRVVQLLGKKILKADKFVPGHPPIDLVFPYNCNDDTKYLKVEIWGPLIAESSIAGDVECHGDIQCGSICGSVKCAGNIKAYEIQMAQ